jgi:small-conductance mechanosensitive channel
VIHFLASIDLPFFPRPPAYEEHIAQLMIGAICVRIACLKEPLTLKSGDLLPHQAFMRTTLVVFGIAAILFAAVGFLLDKFWRVY